MKILIVDGMGGGMGRALLEEVLRRKISGEIIAVGSNSIATASMLKSGVGVVATGENAAVYNAGLAGVIMGPIGIILPNAMYGEITPKMAMAVSSSRARKVLIPIKNDRIFIVGDTDKVLSEKINEAVDILEDILRA